MRLPATYMIPHQYLFRHNKLFFAIQELPKANFPSWIFFHQAVRSLACNSKSYVLMFAMFSDYFRLRFLWFMGRSLSVSKIPPYKSWFGILLSLIRVMTIPSNLYFRIFGSKLFYCFHSSTSTSLICISSWFQVFDASIVHESAQTSSMLSMVNLDLSLFRKSTLPP